MHHFWMYISLQSHQQLKKHSISYGIFEEAWRETCVGVAMVLEVFDERDIGMLSCLWEAIHAFANSDKDSVVNKEMFNMVFINEILGGNPLW